MPTRVSRRWFVKHEGLFWLARLGMDHPVVGQQGSAY